MNKYIIIIIILISSALSAHAESQCETKILRLTESIIEPKNSLSELLKLKHECEGSGIYELELGRLYLINKDYDQAIRQFKSGLKNSSNFEKELELSIGNVFMAQKEYDEAVPIFIETAKKFPKFFLPYRSLGTCYLAKGNFETSIENYEKSISLEPTYEAYANVSIAYYSTDNCPKALQSINTALAIDQERLLQDKDSMVIAIRCYADAGKFEVSKNLLAILLKNDPEIVNDTEYVKAGLYLRSKMQASK